MLTAGRFERHEMRVCKRKSFGVREWVRVSEEKFSHPSTGRLGSPTGAHYARLHNTNSASKVEVIYEAHMVIGNAVGQEF